jgi:hypothetical protein
MDARRWQGQREGVPRVAGASGRTGLRAAHPVLALQRAVGNRAVVAALSQSGAVTVQRKAAGTAKAQALARLKKEFGITVVREGTIADQAQRVDGVPRFLSADEAQRQLAAGGWASWSPFEKAPDWTAIVDGLARFSATMGGLPTVTEIIFLKQDYDYGSVDGRLVPRPDVGASFAAGSLLVFEKGTRGRFVASARRMPKSPSSTTTREDVGYEMTHELAHGVVERAMESDPSVLTRYGAEVGWLGNRLYDIGRPEVLAALAAKRVPPESAVLTAKNWEKADVVEQPMAEYMVTSPSEDLPEAIAAYVNRPDVLKARSPRRFAFVERQIAGWRKAIGSR